MRNWVLASLSGVWLLTVGCMTAPSQKAVNPVYLPETAAANAKKMAAERDVKLVQKGEYQSLSEMKLDQWTERLGALKAKMELAGKTKKGRKSSPAPEKFSVLADEMENELRDARQQLRTIRDGKIEEFDEQKAKMDTNLEQVRAAYEKIMAGYSAS